MKFPLLLTLSLIASAQAWNWQLAVSTAQRFRETGDLAQAENVLRDAVTRVVSDGSDPYKLAYTLHDLGAITQDQGKFLEAERLYKRSIAWWEQVQGEVAIGAARTLNNLASLYCQVGKLAAAEKLLARSEAVESNARKPDLNQLALLLQNRGNLRFRQGKYRDAAADYRRALAIQERGGSLRFAQGAGELALVLMKLKQPKEADAYYRRALGIWEPYAASVETDPRILVNLAALYCALGEPLRAEPILQKILLKGHVPGESDALAIYAFVLRETGRKREAKQIEKRRQELAADSEEHLMRHTIAFRELRKQAARK